MHYERRYCDEKSDFNFTLRNVIIIITIINVVVVVVDFVRFQFLSLVRS